MALYKFGVTAQSVRAHHFPNISDFSADSNPTDTTVTEKIDDCAGELNGRLLKESISAATVDAAGATYGPYVVLRAVLRKMVAVAIMPAMTSKDTDLANKWQKELTAFFDRLDDDAATALGDDSLTTDSSDGDAPATHLDEYNIDIGDPATDASDAIPPFRKGDEL